MPRPGRQRAFPEQRAAEGIAGHQGPLARHRRGSGRGLVDDVEHPSPGRDDRADAGQGVMVAAPHRVGQPLHVAGRAHARVAGHGVARRVVQEVRPLVDILGPRLDGPGPFTLRPNVCHAARTQDAEHLLDGQTERPLRDDEVDEVVDVRQPFPRPRVDRHRPVEAERLEVLAGLLDLGGVAVQAVYQVAAAGAQSGREPAVAAADVDDQAALDSRCLENSGSLGLRPVRPLVGRQCRRACGQHQREHDGCRNPTHDGRHGHGPPSVSQKASDIRRTTPHGACVLAHSPLRSGRVNSLASRTA